MLLGLSPACNAPQAVLLPLVLVMTLFAGPLIEVAAQLATIVAPLPVRKRVAGIHRAITASLPTSELEKLISVRTLVFAPLTEEWVFRSCVLALLAQAGFSTGQMIVGAAAAFGVAHLHHYLEKRRSGASVAQAAFSVLFQLSFTSLFGAISSYIFIRTASLGAIVLAHAFCNLIGVPGTGWMSPGHPAHKYRAAIATAYVLGIIGFASKLHAWTEPARAECSLAR